MNKNDKSALMTLWIMFLIYAIYGIVVNVNLDLYDDCREATDYIISTLTWVVNVDYTGTHWLILSSIDFIVSFVYGLIVVAGVSDLAYKYNMNENSILLNMFAPFIILIFALDNGTQFIDDMTQLSDYERHDMERKQKYLIDQAYNRRTNRWK